MLSRLWFYALVRCGLVSILLVSLVPVAWAAPLTVDSVRGDVEFRQAANEPWQDLVRGGALSLPVEVRTGAESSARLVQGGSSFALRSDTRVTIKARVDQPEGLVERIQQWLGTVLYRIERRPDEFSVETPFLVSTVKGTEFVVVSARDSSFVTLFEGSLEVENLGSGERQLMESGDVLEVNETSEMRILTSDSMENAASDDSFETDESASGELDFEAGEEEADAAAFAEELESLRETEQQEIEDLGEEDEIGNEDGSSDSEED